MRAIRQISLCYSVNARPSDVSKLALSTVLYLLTFPAFSSAETVNEPRVKESELKVAFLYNFAKFVEWPDEAFDNASSPIIVGVAGRDPFGPLLQETFIGQMANGRSFRIERFERLEGARRSHILFVDGSDKKRLPQIIAILGGAHVLTVSDVTDFAASGGVIGFLHQHDRLGFEINIDAAERAGLKISSKLLKLAKVVRERRKD